MNFSLRFIEKQDNYEQLLRNPNILINGRLINFLQYRIWLSKILNKLHYTCLRKNIKQSSLKIDEILQNHKQILSKPLFAKNIGQLNQAGLEVYRHSLTEYIKTYEYWKNQIVSQTDWNSHIADSENAFGEKLTAQEVLNLSKQKLQEIEYYLTK